MFGGTTSDTTIDGNEESGEEIYRSTAINTTIKNGWLQCVSNDCNNNLAPAAAQSRPTPRWKAAPNRSLDFLGLPPRSTPSSKAVRSTSARSGICVLVFTTGRDGDRHVRCQGQSRLRPRQAGAALGFCSSLYVALFLRFRSSPEGVLAKVSLTRLSISPSFFSHFEQFLCISLQGFFVNAITVAPAIALKRPADHLPEHPNVIVDRSADAAPVMLTFSLVCRAACRGLHGRQERGSS
ncbi:hypothetical protein AAFG13_04425 [Bradyrhizobium sp. B124]|uniref:hypothetical protein n=1 Tax=Bradyrhizobium sp. B124 TaxID=3140245 RepID=UPI003183CD65